MAERGPFFGTSLLLLDQWLDRADRPTAFGMESAFCGRQVMSP